MKNLIGYSPKLKILFSRTLIVALLAFFMLLTGCAKEAQIRSRVLNSYSVVVADESLMEQQKRSIVVVDQGEVDNFTAPVNIHACDGEKLRYTPVEVKTPLTGKKYKIGGEPIFETVDPFDDLYVRKIKITTYQEYDLQLGGIDSVLVDGEGLEYEVLDDFLLGQDILANYPCASGGSIVASIKRLKILGREISITPGGFTELFVVFNKVDKSIPGDWMFKLLDLPASTTEKGEITGLIDFEFPLQSKGTRITIYEKRTHSFLPWEEDSRVVEEIK